MNDYLKRSKVYWSGHTNFRLSEVVTDVILRNLYRNCFLFSKNKKNKNQNNLSSYLSFVILGQ